MIARARQAARNAIHIARLLPALPTIIETQADQQTKLDNLDADLGLLEVLVAEFHTKPTVRTRKA